MENLNIVKEIKNECGEFILYEGDILHFKSSELSSRDIEGAKQALIYFNEMFSGDEKVGFIADVRFMKKGLSKAVRDFIAEKLTGRLYGTAILVDSGISRIMGNIVLGFGRKSKHKRKIFTKLDDAQKWLLQQKEV